MAEIVADKPFLPRQRTLVVIHGNIGAGKSTTLRFLSSKYERYVATGEVVIIPEPVEDWIDAGLLQALYDNALSSGVFQLAALATRVGAWSKILQDDKARLIFAERSPASDRAIFAKTLLTGHELVAYNLAYNAIAPVRPHAFRQIILVRDRPDFVLSVVVEAEAPARLLVFEELFALDAVVLGVPAT